MVSFRPALELTDLVLAIYFFAERHFSILPPVPPTFPCGPVIFGESDPDRTKNCDAARFNVPITATTGAVLAVGKGEAGCY